MTQERPFRLPDIKLNPDFVLPPLQLEEPEPTDPDKPTTTHTKQAENALQELQIIAQQAVDLPDSLADLDLTYPDWTILPPEEQHAYLLLRFAQRQVERARDSRRSTPYTTDLPIILDNKVSYQTSSRPIQPFLNQDHPLRHITYHLQHTRIGNEHTCKVILGRYRPHAAKYLQDQLQLERQKYGSDPSFPSLALDADHQTVLVTNQAPTPELHQRLTGIIYRLFPLEQLTE